MATKLTMPVHLTMPHTAARLEPGVTSQLRPEIADNGVQKRNVASQYTGSSPAETLISS